MNKSIFGITLVVMLSYGQMIWAGDPAACISGFTNGPNNQVAISIPNFLSYNRSSKAKVSVNGTDITEEFCELTTPDDGIVEIRCKLPLSQRPIAHIAGSPQDFFDIFVNIYTESDPSKLTAGCTHGDVTSSTTGFTTRLASGHGTHTASASCTPSGIDTIVTCPPPPVTPGIDPELVTHPETVQVEFSFPFEDPQM